MRLRALIDLFIMIGLITILLASNLYAKDRIRMKVPIQKQVVTQQAKEDEKPPLELTQPNGQSRWCVEGTYKITWKSFLPKETKLRVEVLRNTSASYLVVAADSLNTGELAWTIPFNKFNFGQGFWKLKISTLDGKHKVVTNFQIANL